MLSTNIYRLNNIMEYKQAINILKSMFYRHSLNTKEKEVVMTAIGVLSWRLLSKSRVKAQRAKRDRIIDW